MSIHAEQQITSYTTYRFKDKDPMIDKLRTVCQDAFPQVMDKRKIRYQAIADECGISVSTLYNWFEGETRRPQFASLCAVARACGYDLTLTRMKKPH